MGEDRAQAFLQMIRRSQRGRLKVYLGYGPGVGKTYQMLQEAQRLKREGIDIVIGLVETHGRTETVRLLDGLELVPRRTVEYHGINVDEMDADAVIARRPQVAVIDELAHTNAPGSRNAKRYQDVQDILAAGIHVLSTLNIQHLESLYNTVETLIGVKVRERIPDSVLAEADQIVNIDLASEDLQKRLREGNIYPSERIAASLENYFTSSNLEHLRELALRELASQLDFKRRENVRDETISSSSNGSAPDQVMVCLSSRGPDSARLLRFASRLAGRLNRNWYAVYVQTPSEDPTVIDAVTQRLLSDTLTLANQLGATVFTFKGQDIADTIVRFAREYRVGQIVIGRSRRLPWWRRALGQRSVAEDLIERARGITVTVIDAEYEDHHAQDFVEPAPPSPPAEPRPPGALARLLSPGRIVIFDDAVSKRDIRQRLVQAIVAATPGLNEELVTSKLIERENQGSTYLNEGVALPHARIDGLQEPQAALALTHGGVMDAATERPIEAVFLLLSPEQGANVHLQVLAKAGRLLQNREVRRRLASAQSSAEVLEAVEDYESPRCARAVEQ